jgi:hypothetical protein
MDNRTVNSVLKPPQISVRKNTATSIFEDGSAKAVVSPATSSG